MGSPYFFDKNNGYCPGFPLSLSLSSAGGFGFGAGFTGGLFCFAESAFVLFCCGETVAGFLFPLAELGGIFGFNGFVALWLTGGLLAGFVIGWPAFETSAGFLF